MIVKYTDSPFFSVVIPTLNEKHFLPHILDDLAKQKTDSFEVIIVDGRSDDGTCEEASQFKDKLKLHIISTQKRNVAYQRNIGAQSAEGKYVIFIDADSRIPSSFIKKAAYLVKKKKGLVFIPAIISEEKSTQAEMFFQLLNFFIDVSQSMGRPFSTGGCMIVDRGIFLTIGGFKEKLFLAEDHDLIYEAYKWGIRAKFLKDLQIKFSFRRIKREGKLKFFYKYFLATAHFLFKGEVKKKLFEYEMGGQLYNSPETKEYFSRNIGAYSVNNFISHIKKIFSNLLEEEKN
ncbi:MAG: glycosyltransferase [bacterium]|nr:glycosyltransferase [bacterium]